MFPLRFRLCQKGKEYKINTWIFYSKLWNFYSKFPFSPPKWCWLTLLVTGVCVWAPAVVECGAKRGYEGGVRGKATAHWRSSKAKSHLLWPLSSFPWYILSPRGVSKAIPLHTHQPWLVSLGEGHFIHKNASLSFFKKKKNCSTMVICIPREKKIWCALPSHQKN